MPTNYPGDPTAAESPSVAPDEDDVPTQALPVDGDPPNAATFSQPYKTPADWIAWLKKPFAKVSAWAQPIVVYLNALLQPRFLVDHMGFPGGNIAQWQENWAGLGDQVGTGTATFTCNQTWNVDVLSSGLGLVAVGDPDAVNTFVRSLVMTLGTGATDHSNAQGPRSVAFAPTQGIAWEVDVGTDTQVNQMTFTCGLSCGGNFEDPTPGFAGILFQFHDTDLQWRAVAGDGVGITALTATGVSLAALTHFKLRIEYHGASEADDATEACRFYINGNIVATLTSHMPSLAATPPAFPFFSMKRTTGSAARTLYISPMRVSSNY